MASPHEDRTHELIEDLRVKRRRRAWMRVLLIGVGTVVVLAGLVTGVVLATAADEGASSSTLSSTGEVTESTVRTSAITSEPATTVPATTYETPSSQPTLPVSTTATPASLGDAPARKVVVIDPGHQAHADTSLEPIGPGSSTKKAKVSSGTSSTQTGVRESVVALAVGLKLRDALEARGISVIMTRATEDVDISNIERAQVGNDAYADLTVRLHANGSGDSSVHGLFTLYPASIKGWTDDIAAPSKSAATIVQRNLVVATGARDRGLQERRDLTGFNWSDVPVILVEMGFMSNPTEDEQLRTPAYQDKIVQGLVNAILEFLGTEP